VRYCRAVQGDQLSRQNISSGYAFEDTYGYSRAVRVGNQVLVSGTTARPPQLGGDAYVQAKAALAMIAEALAKAGAGMQHVVRTVVYVIDMADIEHVARAHSFGRLRSHPPRQHAGPGQRAHAGIRTGRDRGNGDHLRLIGKPGLHIQPGGAAAPRIKLRPASLSLLPTEELRQRRRLGRLCILRGRALCARIFRRSCLRLRRSRA
jgi:enamine deaminase RidA (YjgF/YER057c/UK114 family)